ncbi:MAG: erythromycin esterase family protein [Clostridia bacterium]|nr:erythromycin esterase family protein [Clostridia bacterium]
MQKQRKHTGLKVMLSIFAVLLIAVVGTAGIYSRFGGFGTGECADTEEFPKYATSVDNLTIPDEAQIVALGEATHGNKEFQQLRLDVFKVLVEKYGVRAFALEGDFGGCEAVNRYIHGGDGTASQAISAIGFAIYRTDEMENLVEWMRDYNASAAKSEDLRFYGFDMEQYAYSYRYLLEALQETNIDTEELEKIWDAEKNAYADAYTSEQCAKIIGAVKEQLTSDDEQALHFADLLLQNIELGKYLNDSAELNAHRDRMMAENTLWVLRQEQARGNKRIMISGHNNHIMRCKNAGTSVLGSLLVENLGDGYFAIGTDFYKSVCNLPKPYTGKRITHAFYSYDPLAKAAKKCGFDVSYLNFSAVPQDSPLANYLSNKIQMGSLGEAYSILMNFVPRSYRVMRTPQDTYDAMVFVANATPIEINPTSSN